VASAATRTDEEGDIRIIGGPVYTAIEIARLYYRPKPRDTPPPLPAAMASLGT
jgi:hypothetical protein